ncbi:hypothetical protein [Endozoicomonas euniceicola]|uniref:Uncharacterized protein n=1 Tax=Endozoicomonas euniceicola TaxID=1234143 RepID=A0ABY6GZU7_9GAMM|nr:hypothetical protein [Endozoicomonas euniceicola]UYM18335.1 hypothetical protein NX720_10640 [Endozoicomonas euniceicola]
MRVSTYLAARHKIVDHSLRDRFSAGGKIEVIQGSITYGDVPRIFEKLKDPGFLKMVRECIETTDPEVLADYWGQNEERLASLDKGELFKLWVSAVDSELRVKHSGKEIPDPKRLISDTLEASE